MENKNNIKLIQKYILAVTIIFLSREMYFYPLDGAFRFSLSVSLLNLIILLYEDINEIYLTILTGLSILFLSSFLHSFFTTASFLDMIKLNLPAALYYFIYGLLVYLVKLKSYKDNPIRVIYMFTIIDVSSNLIEALSRNDISLQLFKYISLVALIRSLVSYSIYALSKNQELLIRRKEHQKKYIQLNTLISNIQAEMFYLTKSMADIEEVMSKSYKLYENTKDNKDINNLALDIAREVHEIKKDYHRVISGFENFVEDFEVNDSMNLRDISLIIEENINRYMNSKDKDIQINIKFHNHIYVKNYYSLFTIINNLIINGIDAIKNKGSIDIEEVLDGNQFIFKVTDSGEGIEDYLKPHIFNPGFTTKYDDNTGEPSTGIGLSHVYNIVTNLDGTIQVKSEKNIGTTFTVSIPLESLRR